MSVQILRLSVCPLNSWGPWAFSLFLLLSHMENRAGALLTSQDCWGNKWVNTITQMPRGVHFNT